MPSPRRMRLVLLAATFTVVLYYFYSSSSSQDANPIQDFYHKTMDGMKKDPPGQAIINSQTGQRAGHIPADKDGDGDVDEDDKKVAADMQVRLKKAEQKAKENANSKGGLKPDDPSKIVGKGNAAAGQPKPKPKELDVSKDSDKTSANRKEAKEAEKQGEAEVELDSILKKAPVVIFSKTYCSFSKRAKGILLDKYTISPTPHVVELDEHPLGRSLQDLLLERTGRKTVPNILINGVSIGGADEVVELDNQDKLASKIKVLGNKRVTVSERFTPGDKTF